MLGCRRPVRPPGPHDVHRLANQTLPIRRAAIAVVAVAVVVVLIVVLTGGDDEVKVADKIQVGAYALRGRGRARRCLGPERDGGTVW